MRTRKSQRPSIPVTKPIISPSSFGCMAVDFDDSRKLAPVILDGHIQTFDGVKDVECLNNNQELTSIVK